MSVQSESGRKDYEDSDTSPKGEKVAQYSMKPQDVGAAESRIRQIQYDKSLSGQTSPALELEKSRKKAYIRSLQLGAPTR